MKKELSANELVVKQHKSKLKKYIKRIRKDDGVKASDNYSQFIGKLFLIFGDKPPRSWRYLEATYEYPVFRVFNKKTGKENDFLRVMASRIVVTSKFCHKGYAKLFPIQKDFYGQGKGVLIQYKHFSSKTQDMYVECIKDIFRVNKDIQIIS